MNVEFELRLDSPVSPEVVELLNEHYLEVFNYSPPDSVHALDESGISADEVLFWSAWQGGELATCAARREINSYNAELKSMKTANSYLRRGAAAALLRTTC